MKAIRTIILLAFLLSLTVSGCASLDVLYDGQRKPKTEVAVLKHIHKRGQIDCIIKSIDGITKNNKLVEKMFGAEQSAWNYDYAIELLPGEHTIITLPHKDEYNIINNDYDVLKYNFEAGKTYRIKYFDLNDVRIEKIKN